MKQISIGVLSIVFLLSILLVGCTGVTPTLIPTPFDPIQLYVDNAKAILAEYKIDGEIRAPSWCDAQNFCTVSVTSEGFANLSYAQQVEIVDKLGEPELNGNKFLPHIEVISGEKKYAYEDGSLRSGPAYPTPFIMPKGDFTMSWDTYNSQYNSSGGILTITKHGSKYTMKTIYSDGSATDTVALTVLSEGTSIKLAEDPNDYSGDYMLISSDGNLSFYDNQGLIYSVSLK